MNTNTQNQTQLFQQAEAFGYASSILMRHGFKLTASPQGSTDIRFARPNSQWSVIVSPREDRITVENNSTAPVMMDSPFIVEFLKCGKFNFESVNGKAVFVSSY